MDLRCGTDSKAATYVIIETKDRLEVIVTPCSLSVLKQIIDSFSLKFNNVLADTQFLSLKNDVIPHSTVELFSKMPVSLRTRNQWVIIKYYYFNDN